MSRARLFAALFLAASPYRSRPRPSVATSGAFAEVTANPGIGRAEALRRSMRALIADRSSPRNVDPRCVLVGEGG